jgi:hypothetical protein
MNPALVQCRMAEQVPQLRQPPESRKRALILTNTSEMSSENEFTAGFNDLAELIRALVSGGDILTMDPEMMSRRLQLEAEFQRREYDAWNEAYLAALVGGSLDVSLVDMETRLNGAIDCLTQQLLDELVEALVRAAMAEDDHRSPVVESAFEALLLSRSCSKLGRRGLIAALRLCEWAEGRLPAGEPETGPDCFVWHACRDLRAHMDVTADRAALVLARWALAPAKPESAAAGPV